MCPQLSNLAASFDVLFPQGANCLSFTRCPTLYFLQPAFIYVYYFPYPPLYIHTYSAGYTPRTISPKRPNIKGCSTLNYNSPLRMDSVCRSPYAKTTYALGRIPQERWATWWATSATLCVYTTLLRWLDLTAHKIPREGGEPSFWGLPHPPPCPHTFARRCCHEVHVRLGSIPSGLAALGLAACCSVCCRVCCSVWQCALQCVAV